MSADRNIESQKVRIYAQSLLQCAGGDSARILEYDTQIHDLVTAYYANKRLADAFTNELAPIEEREANAAAVLEPFDEGIRPILVTMAVRGDIPLASRIANAYTELAEEQLGAVIVDVTTVVELDDHLRDVIKAKLAKDFGKDAILREQIDPEIIGGIIMSAHGRRIDASIAKQLENARAALSSSSTGGER